MSAPGFSLSQPTLKVDAELYTANALIDRPSFKHEVKSNGSHEFVVFKEKFRVEGVILVYWDVNYEAVGFKNPTLNNLNPSRSLKVRFYPDDKYQKTLPRFRDSEGHVTRRIFIYDGKINLGTQDLDLSKIEFYKDIVSSNNVYSKFGSKGDRIGYAVQRVSLDLEGLYSVFDYGHRFLFSRASNINVVDSKAGPRTEKSPDSGDEYLARPWVNDFMIKQEVLVFEAPRRSSKGIFKLKEGDVVEVLRDPKNGWVLIRGLVVGDGESSIGYLNSNKLWLID
ncbi:MAG: SH3 domain-containing protein [Rhizobacter sp.]